MDTHSDILDILKNCWSGDELEALLDILDLKQHELVPVLRLEVFYREISSQALLDEAERTCLTPAQMNTFLERHKLSLHPRASDMRRRCVEYVQLSFDALGPYFLDTKTDLWNEDGGLSDIQLVKAIEIWEANLKSDRMQGSGQVGGARSNKRYHDSQEASTSTANQGYISSQPSQDATSTIHDSAKRRRINDDDDSDLDYIDTDVDSEDDDFEMVSPYSIEATSERVFARNRAHQITYTVKFSHQWRGKLLTSLFQEFEEMFEKLLRDIRMARDLDDQDLGLIIIRHRDLQTPAVFSLRKWSEITAVKILELLQKLLNSNQSLRLDESFEICIGSIRFPRGGHPVKFINAEEALDKKRSIVPIRNNDELCMARALSVCFCSNHQVTDEQWAAVVESNHPKRGSLLKLVLDEKKCSKTIYANIRKNSSYQKSLALLILERARIYHAATRALSIKDIPCIERTLQARIVVISTASGNQIIYKGAVELPEDCPTFFLLHVKDSHFSAITNIKGFYSRNKFCYSCLKPYDHVEKHVCAFSCAVCGSNACSFAGARECDDCHMLCRSEACYERHKNTKEPTQRFPNPQSMCQKKFCCPVCSKIMKVRDRNPKQHVCGEWLCPCCKRYNVGTHLCYQRIPTPRKDKQPKFAFFDFETRQDSIMECQQGYTPSDTDCDICVKKGLTPCPHRSKCTLCADSTCGKPTHIANFVVCQTACHLCMDEVLESSSKCPGCGSRCSKCEAREDKGNFKTPPCADTCGQREVIFEGDSTAYDFGKWLFSTSHKDFVVLSHNSKAFDNWFLLEYLISQGITPSDVSFAGSKIMSLTVGKGLNIKLLDSLNFMPMALSALTKAFGLTELAKGYFPHNFNTVAHQNYRGPYPESHFYGPDNMRIAARDQFVAWHAQKLKEGAIFDFRKDMLKYCRADVDILRQACLKFRQLILNVTGQEQESGVDPYDYTTIAGVCMGIFKRKFLKEEWKVLLGDPCGDDESPSGDEATTESSSSDIVEEVESDDDEWLSAKKMGDEMHVYVDGQWVPTDDLTVAKKVFVSSNMAQVPSHGYTYSDQYSKASIIWFKWLEQCHEEETGETLNIQHALNGGEFRVPNSHYKLDGWDPVRKHCYEFHSCLLHGCETCYPKRRNSVRLPRTKQTANELFALTKKKKTFLESLGYTYEAMWYHEYVELQKNCTDFKEFVTNCDIEAERLKPRDAFFGGRTNACKLHYMVKEGEHIKYVDFTSLYPYVNKYARYPVGHPQIYTQNFKPLHDYFGLAKVKILPPQRLYHPVLPYRSGGKLKFPLCRTCCESENTTKRCHHNESDRSLTGTWCTPELLKALDKGYILVKIYEVYHWPESTQYDPNTGDGGIFGQYINTFLKLKQESSDWPGWCQNDSDRQRYLETYLKHEGIQLEPQSIKKNPGLRSVAKLMLNSLWGKMGENLDKRSHSEFHHESDPSSFYKTLTDCTKEVTNFHILNEKHIFLEWKHKEAFKPEDYKTNVFWACFTTCEARLKLYGLLDMLQERVLYFDTDSVVYVSRPHLGEPEPPLGDMLGELTNEISSPTDYIETFVSAGPKNYAYKTLEGEQVCKVRGFTLNFTNSQLINFNSVRDLVLGLSDSNGMVIVNPSKIRRDKLKCKLYNVLEKKQYRMVYTKRVILDSLDTLPFGHLDIPLKNKNNYS